MAQRYHPYPDFAFSIIILPENVSQSVELKSFS